MPWTIWMWYQAQLHCQAALSKMSHGNWGIRTCTSEVLLRTPLSGKYKMLHLWSAAACQGSCLWSTCQRHWPKLARDHVTPVCSESLVPRLTCFKEQGRCQRSLCAVLAPALPLERLGMSVTGLMGISQLQQSHSLTNEEQTDSFPWTQ